MPLEKDKPFRFDRSISLGHLLTIISFMLMALAQWNVMDKRVTVLEEFRLSQRERDGAQDSQSKEKFQEVRDALTELRRSVEKVVDKLGAR